MKPEVICKCHGSDSGTGATAQAPEQQHRHRSDSTGAGSETVGPPRGQPLGSDSQKVAQISTNATVHATVARSETILVYPHIQSAPN